MLLCRRKSKLEFGFSLIEMIVCLFLLSIFFLLFPRLHFIEMENKQSKGLNDWEWDVFLGQILKMILHLLVVIELKLKPIYI
ncbi:prepilin-type N-terminal cleavage/methylation domain-containing protein [Bacillus thuringiensis]|nr:prepilin-type N-terminal cleavage/methylation domain-containing protein [Bacillus thuringiensis]MDR4146549.1 prepilin-type N-terminal cleavage/methylation domain-containing protein [Bacillus thuringiensis]HDR5271057.1 prepilin-type N-terminal cleavage/methylation domain-containing protein [Bacillus thuringiensis]